VKIIPKHLGENGKTFITCNKNNEGFFLILFFLGPSAFKGHMKIKIYVVE
jgi:hypothetical protein